MKKPSRYFTFLYVPTENTGLRTVRIPRWLAYGFFGTILVLIGATATAVFKYSGEFADMHRLGQLDRENRTLRAQLAEFRTQVDVLDRQVQQNFDFQKKARLLASLDNINEDVAEVGVGGPNEGYVQSLLVLDETTRKQVSALRDDIGKLVRQAKLQSDSYGEIVDVLSRNREQLNCTPSICPVPRGYISSRFGRRIDPITGRLSNHWGIDYSVRLGTPILATADGVVTFAGKWGGFGLTVEISHGFDYVTRYAHTSRILVRKGQRVKRGDVIARVGSSGRSTATHLHYEVIYSGKKKNPLAFMLSSREVVE